MSQFSRPRPRFNRQVCQDVRFNPGKNQYGLANQRPNNPLSYTLASLQKGIADGAFMKTTITGTKLPDPIAQLKEFNRPPRGGGVNPPDPRIPEINAYTIREGENNNPRVRQEAMQQARAQLRGRIAVAQRPNVLRREAQINQINMKRLSGEAALRANIKRYDRIRGFKVDAPVKLTPEEEKIFTYQEFVDTEKKPRKERVKNLVSQVKAERENLDELAKKVQAILDKNKEKKIKTPATEVQKSREPGIPARRRRLVMDSGKKGIPEEPSE
jgi:hypothetical protein